jgi:hypothetical protein
MFGGSYGYPLYLCDGHLRPRFKKEHVSEYSNFGFEDSPFIRKIRFDIVVLSKLFQKCHCASKNLCHIFLVQINVFA